MTMLTTSCRCCARPILFAEDVLLQECSACATLNTRPKSQGAALDVLRRANQQRTACDFVNAERSYQHVLLEHPDEHEALWGLALCRYGVEYVSDPRTGKRMPTLHFLRRRPMQEDADVQRACSIAPQEIRRQYQADAAYVDEVARNLPAPSIVPCDVFLCYKATIPGTNDTTEDLERARKLHIKLTQLGWNVFFAHESLQRAVGANYEATIFRALSTAKVMLLVCSRGDWLMSPWVHSEWSRYLERTDQEDGCTLIPLLYGGMNPAELPATFSYRCLEGLRMDELDAFGNLRAALEQIAPKSHPAPEASVPASATINKALLRIEMALEDGDWPRAQQLTASLLDEQPDCSQAHLYQLLAKWKLHTPAALGTCESLFENDAAWRRAKRFASDAEQKQLARLLSDAQAYRQQKAEAVRTQAAMQQQPQPTPPPQPMPQAPATPDGKQARPPQPPAGQLVIHRKLQYAGSAGSFYIFLDGKKVADLKVGQSVTLPIHKDCELSVGTFFFKAKPKASIKAGTITEVLLSMSMSVKIGIDGIQCDVVSVKPVRS